ncbi:MAG: DUF3160 domain-containing protein [Bacilli bacterium]
MDYQNFNQSTSDNLQPIELKSKNNKLPIFLAFILLVIIAAAVYFVIPKSSQEIIKQSIEYIYKPSSVLASKFAIYEATPVTVTPKIPDYSIKEDLSNVSNASDFSFLLDSVDAKNLLVKNAFVVKEANYYEFFSLYENNRYSYVPNFITTDSIIHNYHLMFDFLLRKLEEEELIPELKQLNANMLTEAMNQYNNLRGTEWENAAKRNVGFFTVGSKLLDSSVNTPIIVQDEVEQELELIDAHQGIRFSPVVEVKEDYSQYIPRGHYTKTDELKAYFKSMMWYGRLTFILEKEDAIRSAILMTLSLSKDGNEVIWNKIYEPTNFFVGKSDDITYYDFIDIAEDIYGDGANYQTLVDEKDKLASFLDSAKKLEGPKVNSMPVYNSGSQEELEEQIKGFRFMGQRFTVDAFIFQNLIDSNVENRMLPNGLDVPAAMGSNEALNILTELKETNYPNYSENMLKMQTNIIDLSSEDWTQNLYWSWLYQLLPLTTEKTSGYPSFMRNDAWVRKDLNAFLGNWSELKHDTVLYAKQAYAELGGGGGPEIEIKDDRGYVEPNVYVYARLASLLKMTSEGLEIRGLLNDKMKNNLSKMEEMAIILKTISEKELNNESLTDEEYEFIRSYGGQLEHLWLELCKEDPNYHTYNAPQYLIDNPAAIITDVATDPNGRVLEVGTGRINEIYVVFPIDGKLKIGKGGVYSYYEFSWSMSDRLTDEKWREMLKTDSLSSPSWTSAFVVEK